MRREEKRIINGDFLTALMEIPPSKYFHFKHRDGRLPLSVCSAVHTLTFLFQCCGTVRPPFVRTLMDVGDGLDRLSYRWEASVPARLERRLPKHLVFELW